MIWDNQFEKVDHPQQLPTPHASSSHPPKALGSSTSEEDFETPVILVQDFENLELPKTRAQFPLKTCE